MSKALVARPSIKAIETLYDGVNFRSRLEARWAVLFDCLELPYLYEPEGYTDGKTRYLPDFFLPTLDAFVEIKPTLEAINAAAIRKTEMLSNLGKPIYIFAGEVGCGSVRVPDLIGTRTWSFCHCMQCRVTNLAPNKYNFRCRCSESYLLTLDSPQLISAILVAKQVRFDRLSALDRKSVQSVFIDTWVYGMEDLMGKSSTTQCFGSRAMERIRDLEAEQADSEVQE